MKNLYVYLWALLGVVFMAVVSLSLSNFRKEANNTVPSLTVIHQQATIIAQKIPVVSTPLTLPAVSVVSTPSSHYIEIIDGCGPYYETGVCVNMRLGPGTYFPVVGRLRTGVVLKVEANKAEALNGTKWYKVVFDKAIRYPERVTGDWYIAESESVRSFDDIGDEWAPLGVAASTTKHIVVSLTEGMLYAYDGDQLFMKEPTSPGLELTPTPRGLFTIYHKTPSRYMQGPIPGISEQEYDLPGVPFNLYFTPEGAVIHGAYWHDHFGKKWSHGCVNLSPANAEKLYSWAEIGMSVLVRD